jgi:hypothetical protein
MVRDKYGRKMSKSLGNVIDPQEVSVLLLIAYKYFIKTLVILIIYIYVFVYVHIGY